MIKDRYISTLLNITDKQIKNGIIEIKNDYGDILKFKDRLICFILKNNQSILFNKLSLKNNL
jgi:hypothetical protein